MKIRRPKPLGGKRHQPRSGDPTPMVQLAESGLGPEGAARIVLIRLFKAAFGDLDLEVLRACDDITEMIWIMCLRLRTRKGYSSVFLPEYCRGMVEELTGERGLMEACGFSDEAMRAACEHCVAKALTPRRGESGNDYHRYLVDYDEILRVAAVNLATEMAEEEKQ